jgi:Tfp pilus assembly protein PilO
MAMKTPKLDLSKLTVREIVIVIGTMISAIGYVFFQFEYTVQTKMLTKLERQSKDLQTSISSFQQTLANPASVTQSKTQIEKITGEIDTLLTAIEKMKGRLTGQDMEVLNELQSEADFYGVFLKSMKTSEKRISRAGLRLKEVSLSMEIISDFDALKKFIAALKNFPAIINIESLETIRNEKLLPKLESRLHIKVVVL